MQPWWTQNTYFKNIMYAIYGKWIVWVFHIISLILSRFDLVLFYKTAFAFNTCVICKHVILSTLEDFLTAVTHHRWSWKSIQNHPAVKYLTHYFCIWWCSHMIWKEDTFSQFVIPLNISEYLMKLHSTFMFLTF